jgi:hypothetical protein
MADAVTLHYSKTLSILKECSNGVCPLGLFENLPLDLIILIEEKRHRILMAPIFEFINKLLPKPEMQNYFRYYTGITLHNYCLSEEEYINFELVLPRGVFFVGDYIDGKRVRTLPIEKRIIQWIMVRITTVHMTRKQHRLATKQRKKNACRKYEYILSAFDKVLQHEDTDSDWTMSDISEDYELIWSSDDEFDIQELYTNS